MTGKIVKAISGFYYVDFNNTVYECRAKGILRREDTAPMVGDNVMFEITSDSYGNVTSVIDRKNHLLRPPVANVDLAVIVLAVKNPEPSLLFIDKQIIFFEKEKIKPIICINKIDIGESEKIEKIYSNIGYEVITVSALKSDNIEVLKNRLYGKTVVFVGNSGVGKSSITNKLLNKKVMEEGETSKIERGKQTTRHSELINLNDDTYIIDTPGFSSFELRDITLEELPYLFVEFRDKVENCEYRDCKHILENNCAIKNAVSTGEISAERYENFKLIKRDIENREVNYARKN